jgi:aspartyl-tRNA(Asn)/glutamyl-tRNA(Gln) amidotransferase subunit C
MKITGDEARRIAELAHLQFDDAGLERMAAEMTKILTYIDQLREVDAGAAEGGGAPRNPTPLREDVARPGISREDVERNAPAWRDGHFVVPKVIE